MQLWTDKDEATLIKLWLDNTAEYVAIELGRTKIAVCSRATKMGLQKSKAFMAGKGRKWTPTQEKQLRDMWDKYTLKEISDKVERSTSSVNSKARLLGLIYNAEVNRNRLYKKSDVHSSVAGIKPIKGTVSLRDITDKQCRYVTDTGADMMLCGSPVLQGHSYCTACCDVVSREFGKKRDVNVKPIWGTRQRPQSESQ